MTQEVAWIKPTQNTTECTTGNYSQQQKLNAHHQTKTNQQEKEDELNEANQEIC